MEYYSQAEYDGLCGFYAALNAFAYLAPLPEMQECLASKADRQKFFDCAVDSLARVRGVGIQVIKGSEGLDEFQIEELCKMIAVRRALPVSVERPDSLEPKTFATRYLELISFPSPFALITSVRNHSHWVTIVNSNRVGYYTLIDKGLAKVMKLGPDARGKSVDAIILKHDWTATA